MFETIISIVMVSLLIFSSVILGRFFCGKICPIGYIQGLIFKIPFPAKIKTFKLDKYLRYIKYGILLIFVFARILFPSLEETNNFGPGIFTSIIIIFIFFILLERPFCKYFCCVGALLSFSNKISLCKYRTNEKCIKCGVCSKVCKMNIEPFKTPNSLECIRCGACIKACPYKAIISGLKVK